MQFLDQRQDALQRYETAIEIYRQVGESPSETLSARLGEANTLAAMGLVYRASSEYQSASRLWLSLDGHPRSLMHLILMKSGDGK